MAIFSASISSYFMLGLLSTKTVTCICNLNGIDIEFYEDRACTKKVNILDWRVMKVDKEFHKTLYIKNSGETPVILNMNISDYISPDIKDLMSLSWDIEGLSLFVGESTPATFSLTINKLIRGINEIDYNITISGTE